MYYFPENCTNYTYSASKPDVLRCLVNNKPTGQLVHPASQQDMDDYKFRHDQYQYQLDHLNRSLVDEEEAEERLPLTACESVYGRYGGMSCPTTDE